MRVNRRGIGQDRGQPLSESDGTLALQMSAPMAQESSRQYDECAEFEALYHDYRTALLNEKYYGRKLACWQNVALCL